MTRHHAPDDPPPAADALVPPLDADALVPPLDADPLVPPLGTDPRIPTPDADPLVPPSEISIWGIVLRSFLVVTLQHATRPMRGTELAAALRAQGFTTPGRPSKEISDALRWEERRGRVRRVGRGVWRVGHVPKATAWRMRQRLVNVRTGGPHDPEAHRRRHPW